MDYVVRPLPNVTARLAEENRSVQDRFQEIASILAINPFPNPQFPLITEDWTTDGAKIYTYSDDVFAFAIQYVIFEPAGDDFGMIAILDIVRIQDR